MRGRNNRRFQTPPAAPVATLLRRILHGPGRKHFHGTGQPLPVRNNPAGCSYRAPATAPRVVWPVLIMYGLEFISEGFKNLVPFFASLDPLRVSLDQLRVSLDPLRVSLDPLRVSLDQLRVN